MHVPGACAWSAAGEGNTDPLQLRECDEDDDKCALQCAESSCPDVSLAVCVCVSDVVFFEALKDALMCIRMCIKYMSIYMCMYV